MDGGRDPNFLGKGLADHFGSAFGPFVRGEDQALE
jgi:hypothetical protein